MRIGWDEVQEKYYFSVVDIVQVLTDSADYHAAEKLENAHPDSESIKYGFTIALMG